jgi:GalNAc-alpha-(1->4)-GalNAc-alpha-(1->3)-diNAcBac-PP-undecaprenol alpha-1,4-N-acetyl-D-galactosaminyltransferase
MMLRMRRGSASALKFEQAHPSPATPAGAMLEPCRDGTTPSKRKRLAFVIAHLGPGGAQRVAVNAANAFVERGHDVHMIVVNENSLAYRLDPRVVLHRCSDGQVSSVPSALDPGQGQGAPVEYAAPVNKDADAVGRKLESGAKASLRRRVAGWTPFAIYIKPVVVPLVVSWSHHARVALRTQVVLGLLFSMIALMRRSLRLRRRLKVAKPDAVLSFLTQTNILTVLATRGLNTRTVISERNDPRLQRHRLRVELMRRLVYRQADIVTANSRGALTALEPFVPKRKLAFLPNPLMPPTSTEIASLQAPTIITVGRLVEQKGIDVLLAAWAQSAEHLPEWRLAIVGDGPLRDTLQARSRELGIEGSVDWHGHLADPFPLLRASKFFVMTSRFEGTPNALLEAMACGLPGIVSDASPGPCELVGMDERAGLIVPVEGATETAAAIVRLAREEPLRRRLAAAARERAREHEPDQALKVWLQLLRCE